MLMDNILELFSIIFGDIIDILCHGRKNKKERKKHQK